MAENDSGEAPRDDSAVVAEKPVESFESCLEELEKVVRELEAGDLSLDRSVELFERGMQLSDSCRRQLEEAETRVEQLIRKDGKMTAQPFRPEKT